MRYDQSIRVLKQILDRGELGDPVLATIEMHAIPHWQSFLAEYDRLTLANMSVHHLDALRYLFGEPTEIYTVVRTDPRTTFEHTDGIVVSTLRFPDNVLAVSMEDVWCGPREEGFDSDIYIKWRVEGTAGVAQGTIGWPTGDPSTLTYASTDTTDGNWVTPTWDTHWFPHAFIGVMEQVQYAVETGHRAGALGRRQRADHGRSSRPATGRSPSAAPSRSASSPPEHRTRCNHTTTLPTPHHPTRRTRSNDAMIQLGIFSGYFPYDLETTAKTIRDLGFNTVQLDLHFKDVDLSAGQITKEKAKQVRDTFRDARPADLRHLGLHEHRASRPRRAEAPRRLAQGDHPQRPRLRHAYVISESGTFNPSQRLGPDPHNRTEDAYEQARDVLAELAQTAYDHGSTFLLETYVNNVIGSRARDRRVFNDVRSPGLELLMDPTNYFDELQHRRHGLRPERGVRRRLGDRVRIAHAKDVKRAGDDKSEKHADIGDDDALASHTFRGVGEIELPAAGLGSLNYDLYLQRLSEQSPNVPLIIEHLDESDVPRAKKFVQGASRSTASEHGGPTNPRGPTVAIVTGAGGALGRATALRLGADGFAVAALGRAGDALDETVACSRRPASRAHRRRAAICGTRRRSWTASTSVEADFGPVEALVNNAAIYPARRSSTSRRGVRRRRHGQPARLLRTPPRPPRG